MTQYKVPHSKNATQFLQNLDKANWHDQALWYIRQKRDAAAHSIPEWETLREFAAQIKWNVLSNLDDYLLEFERNATANGATVHWASDAAEHNRIVHSILEQAKVKRLVKSKSMLTEECKLNSFLESKGVQVVDTDLGERIIQLKEEPPSHIVLPAIHLKKEEIGDLFREKMQTEPGNNDPSYLTEAARHELRDHFLESEAALTGCNFAIAETGGVVVCTNEGNADMGVHTAPIQIHCMGIEKIIPKAEHLGVFLRLLARSGTGQPITVFSAHHHRPRPGCAMHIVIVDNGRTVQLGRQHFRRSLTCIRCGACMNTCPIYRRSGGHSYEYTVPGPIGAVLTPGIDLKKFAELPFASTLCGSCSDVCPVKIDLDQQLYQWRQIVAKEGLLPKSKSTPMGWAAKIFARPRLYDIAGRIGRFFMQRLPLDGLNLWGIGRKIPQAPAKSFRQWYKENR